MKGDEKFLPIGSEEEDSPLPGEVAYADQYGAVCRCLNWKDGVRTQITDDTTSKFIIIECLEPDRVSDLEDALEELSQLFQKYLDAEIFEKTILNKDHNEIVIQ